MDLARMVFDRPLDMDPETWFCLAVQKDQNCAADEVFHASYLCWSLAEFADSHCNLQHIY